MEHPTTMEHPIKMEHPITIKQTNNNTNKKTNKNEQKKKIGRNDKCDCGSEKKYKQCCLNNRADKLQQERQERIELYKRGYRIDATSPQRLKKLYDYIMDESDYVLFAIEVVDMTPLLTPETYRQIQTVNYTARTLMLAERCEASDIVFEKRSSDGEYCNLMVMFRGAYVIFHDSAIGTKHLDSQIKDMIHARMNNLMFKGQGGACDI